jgi:selenocysteine lyase/cysteine desulfurase
MTLTRRQFIASSAALAAVLSPRDLLAAAERETSPLPDLSKWADVKAQFQLRPDLLHFSSFFIASHPRPVQQAIEGFRRALDANPFATVEGGLFEDPTENLALKVLADAAPYLGATPDQIALTPNTTTGLALVYHGMPLSAGDEILATTHDHVVHHESIRLAAERSGATWRRVPLYDDASKAAAGEITERVRRAIRPNTRAVGVTWVHSSTGVRLPIRDIAAVVSEANRGRDERDRVLLVVDGVHGLGAVDEDVAAMGCDFFSAGTHKWMFAPRGTGILWGTAAAWSRIRPTIPSFSDLEPYLAWMEERPPRGPNNAARVAPGGFLAFEHQWAMGTAFQLHRKIGRDRVAGRIRELNDQCKAGLAGIRGVKVHTPRDPALSAGIIAFETAGMSPEAAVKKLLERRVVASTSPYRVAYTRLAPSLVNDPGEVDKALAAVREIAAT